MIETVAVIASITAGLVSTIIAFLTRRITRRISLFICDKSGRPKKNIVVVDTEGNVLTPNMNGMVWVQSSWIGKSLSIRDTKEFKEVDTIVIRLEDSRGLVTKTVPDGP